MLLEKFTWWQRGVVYQIYPRSFQDSNRDGIGDLNGIANRIDYLKWLGVKAVWISPVYPSPMADFGYDISNYKDIHQTFGTLVDFELLVKRLHEAGIKVILDLVPNHTSSAHPWFIESRSSRDNPKRNWYLWKDPKADGSRPNNWLATFGGSAWEWDKTTKQYYYHAFLKEQPDLNWRNPEVQEAILDVMKFWLDKGVDGFRIDVIYHIIKDELFRDNPINPLYNNTMPDYDRLLSTYSTDQPEVLNVIKKMRKLSDQYKECVLIGEIYLPVEQMIKYYGVCGDGVHLPFNFQLINVEWKAKSVARIVKNYETLLPEFAWPNWVLGNHDQPRIAHRVGLEQAKIAAILLLTLRGTPTIYYGEEIGMTNVHIPIEEMQDPQGLNMPDKNFSRDPQRTPMHWDGNINAGFTESQNPWLRVANDYRNQNVQVQKDDPNSILLLYKKLIDLRNKQPALSIGEYIPLFVDEHILSYVRRDPNGKQFLIALNFSNCSCELKLQTPYNKGQIVISSSVELEGAFITGAIGFKANEGIVMDLSSQ
ncbi:MAG: alpha-amylase [Dolichospermum sp.]|nr:alpha-amylase [Dolichospermum sp.]